MKTLLYNVLKNIYWFIKVKYRILTGTEINSKIQTKIPVKWFGDETTGFYACSEFLSDKSIVYSFGIGDNISFDIALMKQFNCSVFGFDPTPKSVQFIADQNYESKYKFKFFPFGLFNYDGMLTFFMPANSEHVSCSVEEKMDGAMADTQVQVPVKSFGTIVKELNHTKIDVLKMDIEASEYKVIDDILNSEIEIKQILIEFHHRFANVGINKTKAVIEKLNRNGYLIAGISQSKMEYCFVKEK